MFFFFSSRRRHTRFKCDWSSDVCSSDLCSRCNRVSEGGRNVGGYPIGNDTAPRRGKEVALIGPQLEQIQRRASVLLNDAPHPRKFAGLEGSSRNFGICGHLPYLRSDLVPLFRPI